MKPQLIFVALAAVSQARLQEDPVWKPAEGIAAMVPNLAANMGVEDKFGGDDPLGPVRGLIGGIMGPASRIAGVANFDMVVMLCGAFSNQFVGSLVGGMFGNPNGPGPDEKCSLDTSGGSGPYKAKYQSVDSLVNHTIYAPVMPPKGEKLPVMVWSNGFCLKAGTMFQNFLTEIASHGFLVISNGGVTPDLGNLDSAKDLINAIDWATQHPGAKKFGEIDTENIIVGGQSCGGIQAMAASRDPRVKWTTIFNSGLLAQSKKQISDFKHPVAYFLGGPKDVGYGLGLRDFDNAPSTVPVLVADSDNGHIGSYYQKSGVMTGKAAVHYLKWKIKGDKEAKKLFCDPAADSELVKLGFKFKNKNGMC